MVRVWQVFIVGGALVIVPLGMGGIPLIKLLFFAVAALIGSVGFCGAWLHSLARRIRTASVGAPCSQAPHGIALCGDRMAWGFLWTFFVVVFLSPLWSAVPFLSVMGVEPRFEGVMVYVVYAGLAVVAAGMARSGRGDSLLSVILWSNAGVVLYGLLQLMRLDPFGGWWEANIFLKRVFSTVGQPNMLGQFLLLTAPFAVWTVWRWEVDSLSYVVLALNLLVLLATGSRAGVMGAIVEVCVWMLVTLPFEALQGSQALNGRCEHSEPRRGKWHHGSWLGCSLAPHHDKYSSLLGDRMVYKAAKVLCGVGLLLSISIIGFTLFFSRFSLSGEWDRSIGGRLAIWRDATAMIRERPQGFGLETTGLLFPRFQSAPLTAYESLTTSVDRAHSKPLDLLLTVGLLGLLVYYGFLTMLIVHCLRVWQRHRDGLALAGVASLVGVSVSLLFGFEGITVHAFFWLICGMLAGLPLPAGEGWGEGHGERVRWMLFLFLLVAITFTALSLSSRITAHRAEQAFQSGDLVVAVHRYDHAVREAPFDRALLIRFLETALLMSEELGRRIPSPLGGGQGRGGQRTSQEEILDVALIKSFRHLGQLTSNEDPLLPSLQAWHAALQGRKEEALGFLDDAERRAPFSIPRLRIALHVARFLKMYSLEEAIRTEFIGLLPPWWNNPQDPRHRILLKENPWLIDMVRSPML